MDDGNLHILYCDILACSLRILSFGGHQPTTNVSMMITHSTLSPRNGTKAQWQIVKIINNKSALHTINAFACFAFDLLWCRDTLSPYIYIYTDRIHHLASICTHTRGPLSLCEPRQLHAYELILQQQRTKTPTITQGLGFLHQWEREKKTMD